MTSLRAEIKRLGDEQIEGLKHATFMGMTEEELSDRETKRQAIVQLKNKLIALIADRGKEDH